MDTDGNEPEERYSWETMGTREIPEWEARFTDAMGDVFRSSNPLAYPEAWPAGIVTTAPMPEPAAPLTWEAMRAAMDKVMATPHVRDRWVIADSRWARLLEAAGPELRADLESLRANGTVVVTSLLPDPSVAYRISGSVFDDRRGMMP